MKRWMFLGLAAIASLLWLACGGGEAPPAATTSTPTAEHEEEEAGHEHEGGGALHVSLNEWSITEEGSEATSFLAEAGDVIFEIHNDGAVPHDFKIIRTDLAPDALPVVGAQVDMEAAGEVIGGVNPLPGKIEVEEGYDLEPGRYVLICSIPGHYQQGMFAELTVE